jgi:hypothetical protein
MRLMCSRSSADACLVKRRRVLRDGHQTHTWQRERHEEILQPLPAIRPWLTHDILTIEREEIEGHEAHCTVGPIAFLKDRLNAFVPITGTGFTVKHSSVYGPSQITKPRHTGMAEQNHALGGYSRRPCGPY